MAWHAAHLALSRTTGREKTGEDTLDRKPDSDKNGISPVMYLLAVPFLVLWVPLYNTVEPTLFGFPFFYWFQLVWIFASMIVTAAVYYSTEPH
jgi:hypothetical protein